MTVHYELERYIPSIDTWEYVCRLGYYEPTALAAKVKHCRENPKEKFQLVKITREVLKDNNGN